jgi:hypothetical protein
MNTTPGTWMVEEATDAAVEGTFLHKVKAVGPDGNALVGLVPNLADAALLATSKEMLDTLIWIHEKLNVSKQPISIPEFNARFGEVGEKIAAESGES